MAWGTLYRPTGCSGGSGERGTRKRKDSVSDEGQVHDVGSSPEHSGSGEEGVESLRFEVDSPLVKLDYSVR